MYHKNDKTLNEMITVAIENNCIVIVKVGSGKWYITPFNISNADFYIIKNFRTNICM